MTDQPAPDRCRCRRGMLCGRAAAPGDLLCVQCIRYCVPLAQGRSPFPLQEPPPPVLAVVHDDGHVAALCRSRSYEQRFRETYQVMTRIGVTGYQLLYMHPGTALAARTAGRTCPCARIQCPCGCDARLVGAGACPHGTLEAIHAAAAAMWGTT